MGILETLINEGNEIITESAHNVSDLYEPAMEGIFTDDKNPDIKTEDNSNKSRSIVYYKNKGVSVIGPDWVNVYLKYWGHTTEPFLKSGKKFVTDCVNEIVAGEKYVNQHRKEFIDAFNAKNFEVCDNISAGMRKVFSIAIATSQQENRGARAFGGPVVEMPESLKNALKPELTKFAKIYRETGVNLEKKKIIDVHAKSGIKRLFNYKKYVKQYNAETYLDYELFLYCKDLHIVMDSANFD